MVSIKQGAHMKKIILMFIVTQILLCGCVSRDIYNNSSTYSIEYKDEFGNLNDNLNKLGLVAFDERAIYYSKFQDNIQELWKLQGKKQKKITELNYSHLNIVGKKFYYIDGKTDYIMEMDMDTHEKKIILNLETRYLIAYNNKLYFISVTDEQNNCLFSCDFSGNDVKKLTSNKVNDIYICDNVIYYTSKDTEEDVFRINSVKNDQIEIVYSTNNQIDYFCKIEEGFIVYALNNFYKVHNDKAEILIENPMVVNNTIVNCNNIILYKSMKDSKLHFFDLDENTEGIINRSPIEMTLIYLTNAGIFYYDNQDKGTVLLTHLERYDKMP